MVSSPGPSTADRCDAYFSSKAVSDWSFDAFSDFCSSNLNIKGEAVTDHFVKALNAVADDDTNDPESRSKARYLLSEHRSKKKRRRTTTTRKSSQSFTVHVTDNQNVNVGVFNRGLRNRNRKRAKVSSDTATRTENTETAEGDLENPLADRVTLSSDESDAASARLQLKLSSGRYVLFAPTQPIDTNSDTYYGIISLADTSITSQLTDAETKQLRDSATLPPFSDTFTFALRRFVPLEKPTSEATTAGELRSIIESSPRPPGVEYCRKKNGDASYVNDAAAMILSMIESRASCASMGPQFLQEGWYAANVWGPLIDRCFQLVDDCVLSRTEIKSKSDTLENRRFDGIVCAFEGLNIGEFGAIEVAKSADIIPNEKGPNDMEKIAVVLETMLKALLKSVDYNVEVGKKLCVVGIQHIGFSMQVVRMNLVAKNIFVFHPGSTRRVPTSLQEFSTLFGVMGAIISAKAIVEESINVVKAYHAAKNPDDPLQDFRI